MLSVRLMGHGKKGLSTSQLPKSILPDNVPLEFQVLLSACHVFLGTEEPARLEALLQHGPNWDRMIALSSRHGVMPLLYRSLRQVDRQFVPQEQRAKLWVLYMQNAARNIRMTGELLKITEGLFAPGCEDREAAEEDCVKVKVIRQVSPPRRE